LALFSKRDGMFIYWTLVAALLVMAFMHLVGKKFEPPPATQAQVMEALGSLQLINASQMNQMVENNDGKTTLVFFYASWCSYCVKMMPHLLGLVNDKALEHSRVLFISIDTSPNALAVYLANKRYADQFTPYIIRNYSTQSLKSVLQQKGASFGGGIPYIAVFDSSGALVAEEIGFISRWRILSMSKGK